LTISLVLGVYHTQKPSFHSFGQHAITDRLT
jgi:hypothetical protein